MAKFIARIAALEAQTPRPRWPVNNEPQSIAIWFTQHHTDAERRHFLDEELGGEIRRYCAAQPYTAALPGEPTPPAAQCDGCSGWSIVLTAMPMADGVSW